MSSMDDFDVGQLLGKGGFACVYRARNRITGENVAVKVINKEYNYTGINQENILNRIKNEIIIHRQLKHKNIVKFYTCFEDQQNIYMVLELCNAGNMFQYLKRNGPLPELIAIKIIYQLLEALEYTHLNGIVHRDLKLSNILLTKDNLHQNDEFKIKLCDFGLAVKKEHPDEEHYTLCGTPNYIAPEIASQQSHGFPADLWSIGCLFYSLIVGTPPFEKSITHQVNNNNNQKNHNKDLEQCSPNPSNNVKETLQRILRGEYYEPLDKLSANGVQFLRSLLHLNPTKRANVKQILLHPLLSSVTPSSAKVLNNNRSNSNNNNSSSIDNYNNSNKQLVDNINTEQRIDNNTNDRKDILNNKKSKTILSYSNKPIQQQQQRNIDINNSIATTTVPSYPINASTRSNSSILTYNISNNSPVLQPLKQHHLMNHTKHPLVTNIEDKLMSVEYSSDTIHSPKASVEPKIELRSADQYKNGYSQELFPKNNSPFEYQINKQLQLSSPSSYSINKSNSKHQQSNDMQQQRLRNSFNWYDAIIDVSSSTNSMVMKDLSHSNIVTSYNNSYHSLPSTTTNATTTSNNNTPKSNEKYGSSNQYTSDDKTTDNSKLKYHRNNTINSSILLLEEECFIHYQDIIRGISVINPFGLITKEQDLLFLTIDKLLLFNMNIKIKDKRNTSFENNNSLSINNDKYIYKQIRMVIAPTQIHTIYVGEIINDNMINEIRNLKKLIYSETTGSNISMNTSIINKSIDETISNISTEFDDYSINKNSLLLNKSLLLDNTSRKSKFKFHSKIKSKDLICITDTLRMKLFNIYTSNQSNYNKNNILSQTSNDKYYEINTKIINKIPLMIYRCLEKISKILYGIKCHIPKQIIYFSTQHFKFAMNCKTNSYSHMSNNNNNNNSNEINKADCKCMVMYNDPLPDFYIQWLDGVNIRYLLRNGKIFIEKPANNGNHALYWEGILNLNNTLNDFININTNNIPIEFIPYITITQHAIKRCFKEQEKSNITSRPEILQL